MIAAFGRLGTWFAADRFGVRPDLVCFAKGVTSGYLPLGGVLVSGRVAEPFWERGGTMFRHGPTYSAHPTCCAAALANLAILEREGLLDRGRELEDEIAAELRPLGRPRAWPARSARAWARSGPWRSRPRRCASGRTSRCGSSPTLATAGCSSARSATPSRSRRR